MLTSFERSMLWTIYEYNRIPIWLFDTEKCLSERIQLGFSEKQSDLLSTHISRLLTKVQHPEFELLCYENELYFVFIFKRQDKDYYLLGGPMLLSGFYHLMELKALSFADNVHTSDLKEMCESLPVVSLSSFASCLKLLMLLLNGKELSLEEISNYRVSKLKTSFQRTFIHEFFQNLEDYRLHTPYRQELAVLNCVKEGNLEKLESTYRTLPQTIYGNMSSNPLRQLFYGCIANTTLITRYAIEGGMEEEAAFTLSDVYIKQMENSRTQFELNQLNEKMAVDFTEQVAKAKAAKKPVYSTAVTKCMNYISRHIHDKITLEALSSEINLTPKYLSWLFCTETGQTLSSYIETQKIEEAKNLLIYSSYTYSDISNSLSYNSQSYFITVFKKQTGITPKEFRKWYSLGD